MKYRSGFVTNSSSSSYVIAYKKVEGDKIGREPTFLNKFYQTMMEGLFDYSLESEDDLINRILTLYSCDTLEEALENKYAKDYYDRTIKYIRDGYVVAEREVDYYDYTTQNLINSLIDNENIVMINVC